MRTKTGLRLLRIAGLVLTVPIAFLLFTVAVEIDGVVPHGSALAPGVVGLAVVFVPLGPVAAGIALLLRDLGASNGERSESV